jgi:hypothetical protein
MSMFQNKKILFISPKFFGYEKAVFLKLKELGATVDYIDDRPSNNVFVKAILRIHHKLLFSKLVKYFNQKLNEVKANEYDVVFILNPEGMLPEIIQQFREHFKTAKFVLYMWDSIKNRKHTPSVLHYFDVKYSFDQHDSHFFPGVKFRPLFYTDPYKEASSYSMPLEFDLAFIGTAHSDRYFLLKKIQKQLTAEKLKYFYFLFLTSSKYYWFRKMTEPSFLAKAKIKDFAFKPISPQEIIDVFARSKAILDINHPKQTGLTIRTLEVLALQKKIITTNAAIKDYDFYDASNILVIDRNNPIIDLDFFNVPFKKTPPDILYNYSIEGWLAEVLGN